MLWSIIKVLVFVGLSVAATFGALWVLDTPGSVKFEFAGQARELTPLAFVVVVLLALLAAWILLKLAGLLVAVLRALMGDETAISRYFDRTRERRGYEALSEGLMALAAGEAAQAQAKATKAERLLGKPHLTQMLTAQAAEAIGNRGRAVEAYKSMLTDDRSRFVGVLGLMKQKLEAGETDTALKLAEKGLALRPKNTAIQDALFDMQSKSADWAGARKTLEAKVRSNALPKDIGKRRDAVLSVAASIKAMEDGNGARARDTAYQAVKLAPDFGPAAAMAARLHADDGEKRVAARILKKAWATAPHPDLAAAFAALEKDETPAVRQQRFKELLGTNPDHLESKLTEAEIALAAENFPDARRAIGSLAETHPSHRSLAIMAAIEKGQGAPDAVIRGWLAKAIGAPRGETWVCESCNHFESRWQPVCSNCDAFDTLKWTTAPVSDADEAAAAAMLPMLVAGLDTKTASKPSADKDEDDGIIDATATKPANGDARPGSAA